MTCSYELLFFHHKGNVVLGCSQEICIISDWPELSHTSTSSWKETWKHSEVKRWGDFKLLLGNIQPLEVKHKCGKGQALAWLNLKSVKWAMNSYIFFLSWNIFKDEMKPVCMHVCAHSWVLLWGQDECPWMRDKEEDQWNDHSWQDQCENIWMPARIFTLVCGWGYIKGLWAKTWQYICFF